MAEFLELLIELLHEENIDQIDLLFGPTWIETHKDKRLLIPPEKIKETITIAEEETWGKLSEDNIDLSFAGVSIRLCNDSDIHVEGDQENIMIGKVMAIFNKMGITCKSYNQANESL